MEDRHFMCIHELVCDVELRTYMYIFPCNSAPFIHGNNRHSTILCVTILYLPLERQLPDVAMFAGLFEEEDALNGLFEQEGRGKVASNLKKPPTPRGSTALCGLNNLGATCYLNSILQTLHFTPEFRGTTYYGRIVGSVLAHVMEFIS